jgi:hypothetical protein
MARHTEGISSVPEACSVLMSLVSPAWVGSCGGLRPRDGGTPVVNDLGAPPRLREELAESRLGSDVVGVKPAAMPGREDDGADRWTRARFARRGRQAGQFRHSPGETAEVWKQPGAKDGIDRINGVAASGCRPERGWSSFVEPVGRPRPASQGRGPTRPPSGRPLGLAQRWQGWARSASLV